MQLSPQEKQSYDQNDEDRQLPMYTTRDSDEANAPLYNPPQEVAKPALPEKTASPIEVVNFITKLLIVTRHLTESHAHDIASKWTFGTGDDLLNTYPAQMYREIFGSESGWMVYKEVMLLNYETSHPEGNHRRDGCVGLAITIPIMIAIILLGPRATNSGNMLAIYTVVFGGIFSAIGILIFFAMAVVPKQTPLQLVEGKLKNSFFKSPQGSSTS